MALPAEKDISELSLYHARDQDVELSLPIAERPERQIIRAISIQTAIAYPPLNANAPSSSTATVDPTTSAEGPILPPPVTVGPLPSHHSPNPDVNYVGLVSPVFHRSCAFGVRVATRVFGRRILKRIEAGFVTLLFALDNLNPIPYAKLLAWYSHPAFLAGPTRSIWILPIFRLTFLSATFLKILFQFSGLLVVPFDAFKPSGVLLIVTDAFTDGVKYSGFTNGILLAFSLPRTPGRHGRRLINASRHYMEDVQFVACIVGPLLPILIKVCVFFMPNKRSTAFMLLPRLAA
ncbi:hypothetical protein NLI96_g8306 [Meripilus lineatus]|uniref:Uncharacterized protein n=1 Tax=Meripilus lineatus TaxID=2056292 RepID=A0AAD5V273_9APHY|nr:hypothetical protein NLI96_g8306 [Physisporinus lineatus]